MIKRKPKSERAIETDILTRLNVGGIGYFWKADYPSYRKGKDYLRNPNPYVLRGVADILGVRRGVFFALEVKTVEEHRRIKRNLDKYRLCLKSKNPDHKRYAYQIQFLENVVRRGGVGAFVSDWSQVDRIFKQIETTGIGFFV